MKYLFLVSVLMFGILLSGPASAAAAEKASLDLVAWLEGDWERESSRGRAVESWKRVSDDTMEGMGATGTRDSMRIFERLRVMRFGDEIFYVAKPTKNPLPIPFKLTESDASRLVFENPDHDFPQRIVYTREGAAGLHVRVEGMHDGEKRGFDVRFVRKE